MIPSLQLTPVISDQDSYCAGVSHCAVLLQSRVASGKVRILNCLLPQLSVVFLLMLAKKIG